MCMCSWGSMYVCTVSRTPLEQHCFGRSRPLGARGVLRPTDDTGDKELRRAAPRATGHSHTLVLLYVFTHCACGGCWFSTFLSVLFQAVAEGTRQVMKIN